MQQIFFNDSILSAPNVWQMESVNRELFYFGDTTNCY
jgi:hypothetical protein